MPPDTRPSTRRTLPVVLVLLLAAALAWIWRSLAVPMFEEDGVGLVSALSLARGQYVGWHHAAYLPLGSLVERILGVGYSLSALLWLSAAAAALAVATLCAVIVRERGGRGSWIALAALVASPSVWINATRIEVHTVQMLGAALLLLYCCTARSRGTVQVALGMFVMAVLASTTHNSNVLLLPGAAWIAARIGDVDVDRRRLIAIGAAAALGGYVGLVLDHLSLPGESGSALGDIADLWANFVSLSSATFVRKELLNAWYPMLFAAAGLLVVAGRRGRRAALPFLAAALPPIALFAVSGISTRGGYFIAAMVFLVGALAAATRIEDGKQPRKPWPLLVLMAPMLIAGVVMGYREAQSPRRFLLAARGAARLEQARRLLPDGGCFMELDPYMQSVNGRQPGLHEVNLYVRLIAAIHHEVDPAELVRRIEADLAPFVERGDQLAWGRAWLYMLDVQPKLEDYMRPLETMLHQHYELVETLRDQQMFLVGSPAQGSAR